VATSLAPRVTFSTAGTVQIGGSFSERTTTIVPQLRPSLNTGLSYALSRVESVGTQVVLSGTAAVNGSGFVALEPGLTYKRTLSRNLVFNAHAGMFAAYVVAGQGKPDTLELLPSVSATLSASQALSTSSAIQYAVQASVAPFSNVFGGLLEQRVSASGNVAVRLNRDISVRGSLSTFFVLNSAGNFGTGTQSQSRVTAVVAGNWQLNDMLSTSLSVSNSNVLVADEFGNPSQLRPTISTFLGLAFQLPIIGSGERPFPSLLRGGGLSGFGQFDNATNSVTSGASDSGASNSGGDSGTPAPPPALDGSSS
jgi:hypothetical protein